MEKEKPMPFGYKLLLAFTCFSILYGVYTTFISNDKSNSHHSQAEQVETSGTNESETTSDSTCPRCEGSGEISTYGAGGCSNMAHFSLSDCGHDHHTDSCIASGSKTCPCCNGTGKRS